jgi:acetylornithine aminotransferase
VRGEGLLIAVGLTAPVAADVAARALAAGFVVNPCTPDTIRMAPPYVLTRDQAATFTDFLAALPHDLGAHQ